MKFDSAQGIDAWLTRLFDGAPLLVALGIALLLGLRHAADPDHLVAVTSLVAAEKSNSREAARLGACWGVGHAAILILIGVPLILLKSKLPTWLESGAERAVGLVILLLAGRVLWKWVRGEYGVGSHEHDDEPAHRHLSRRKSRHEHAAVRSGRQALLIGVFHGLAGTGAVVLLLVAALPTRLDALAALLVFAPTSVLSMAGCTTVFAWVLTRPGVAPVYRAVLIPALGLFGVTFGLWYTGVA